QRLPRLFLRHLLHGEPAQLVVDQRQQLFRGSGIALLDGGQDARDVGHSDQCTALELSRLSTAIGVLHAPVSWTVHRSPRASRTAQRAEARHTAVDVTISRMFSFRTANRTF